MIRYHIKALKQLTINLKYSQFGIVIISWLLSHNHMQCIVTAQPYHCRSLVEQCDDNYKYNPCVVLPVNQQLYSQLAGKRMVEKLLNMFKCSSPNASVSIALLIITAQFIANSVFRQYRKVWLLSACAYSFRRNVLLN